MKKQSIILLAAILIITTGIVSFIFVNSSKPTQKPIELNSKVSLVPIINNGCKADEKYDSVEKECYYECENDCGTNDAKIEKEIDTLLKDAKITSESEKSDTDKEIKTTYLYNNGDLDKDIVDPAQKQAWDYFLSIATRDFAKENVALVSFYNNPKSDTMASVSQNEQNNQKWDLEINMKYGEDKPTLIFTLIHEFGHLYSLNRTQVPTDKVESCPTLKLDEGCPTNISLISQFQSKFWKDINADPNTNNYGEHYLNRENSFVSQYAGTNVLEDFAETLAYYIAKDDSGTIEIAKEKIDFMNSNKQIKEMAVRIRSNLGRELQDDKLLN